MNKPGYTTSEFWATLIAQLTAVITLVHPDSVKIVPNAGLVQAFSVLASAIAAGLYAHARARVKVATGTAQVVVPGPATNIHLEPLIERMT